MHLLVTKQINVTVMKGQKCYSLKKNKKPFSTGTCNISRVKVNGGDIGDTPSN